MSSGSQYLTAPDALRKLIEGNRRFVSGTREYPHQDESRRTMVLAGQSPIAVIVSCSDSRVPPEILFDMGIGDLFIIRTAGNVIDDVALGSIEYAVEHLGTPLVVVLGHQKCGAVTATCQGGGATGHVKTIVEKILPAVEEAKTKTGDLVTNAIDSNIALVVEQLRTSEPILARLLSEGKVKIGGARYDLDSGKVTWL